MEHKNDGTSLSDPFGNTETFAKVINKFDAVQSTFKIVLSCSEALTNHFELAVEEFNYSGLNCDAVITSWRAVVDSFVRYTNTFIAVENFYATIKNNFETVVDILQKVGASSDTVMENFHEALKIFDAAVIEYDEEVYKFDLAEHDFNAAFTIYDKSIASIPE